jgi:hypothetical protein
VTSTCKECLFWTPSESEWGFCDGWIKENSPFVVTTTEDIVDPPELELETHFTFSCSEFTGESEHDFDQGDGFFE